MVSIIIPTFNSERLITRCIDSVINQTYSDLELLIVDGESSDKTLSIIREYQINHKNIKYLSEKDKGIYDAMNKGIKLASGEWIYFLGSDDYLYSNTVLESIFSKEENLVSDIIYGDVWNEHINGRYAGPFTYEKLTEKFICHQAIFYNKSVFKKLGLYDINYKVYAHIAFDIKAFCDKNIKWKYVDVVTAHYGAGGYSAGTFDYHFWQNAERLLLDCLSVHVPKQKIYKALEPIVRYNFSFKTLGVSTRTIYYTGNISLTKYILNYYTKYLRLALKKLTK